MLKNMLRGRLKNNILRKVGNPSYGIHQDLNLKNILRNVVNYLTYMKYLPSGTRSIIILTEVGKLS